MNGVTTRRMERPWRDRAVRRREAVLEHPAKNRNGGRRIDGPGEPLPLRRTTARVLAPRGAIFANLGGRGDWPRGG
jgi:hypothetical protein